MNHLKIISLNQLFLALTLLLWSLGQFQRIQLSNISFYLHDLVILFWLVITLFKSPGFFKDLTKLLKGKIIYLGVVVIAISLGFVFNPPSIDQLLTPIMYLSRISLYLLMGVLSYWQLKNQKKTFISDTYFQETLYLSAVMVLSLGFSQYLFFPDTRFLAIFGWDDHYYRLIYPFFDPAFTGQILVLLSIAFYPLISKEKRFFGLSFFLSLAIALTFSRSTYLSFIVSQLLLALMNFSKKNLNYLLITLLSFTLTIFVAQIPAGEGTKLTRTNSIVARSENIKENLLSDSKTDLLFGTGLFSFNNQPKKNLLAQEVVNHARVPDNIFVQFYSQTGLVGLIIFSFLVVKMSFYFFKTNKLLLIMLISLLVHSQFNATIFQPFVLLITSILMGWLIIRKNKVTV